MPNSKSAAKRHRQSQSSRLRNRAAKSAIKSQLKKTHTVAKSADTATLDAEFRATVKKLDQAAAKGVLHKNKAARLKSRLVANLKPTKAPPAKVG